MEKAVFGASGFFSLKAFTSGFRGIENVRIGHLKRVEYRYSRNMV